MISSTEVVREGSIFFHLTLSEKVPHFFLEGCLRKINILPLSLQKVPCFSHKGFFQRRFNISPLMFIKVNICSAQVE